MGKSESKLITVCTVQGELKAHVIKSRLESEGIPAILKYESASKVYGLTVDGLGQVEVLVPAEYAETARQLITPEECRDRQE